MLRLLNSYENGFVSTGFVVIDWSRGCGQIRLWMTIKNLTSICFSAVCPRRRRRRSWGRRLQSRRLLGSAQTGAHGAVVPQHGGPSTRILKRSSPSAPLELLAWRLIGFARVVAQDGGQALMEERLMMQQQQMEDDQRWLEQEESFMVQ